jgi:mRNA interferase RelE/StbE
MNWSAGLAWRIEISKTAEKQIAKLSTELQARIVSFLRARVATAEDPRRLAKALKGDKRGLWRFRVGAYRLICDIQDERITVLVLYVSHRKDVYR